MKIGLYAGSFDPFTNGHLHVLKTASTILDKVILVIGVNDQKIRHYDEEEMKVTIERVCLKEGIKNVVVMINHGLTIDVAKEQGVTILIRGLRDSIDLANEESIAEFNYDLANIDTIYVRAGKMGSISSSKVRELIKYGKDISKFVPDSVNDLVCQNNK